MKKLLWAVGYEKIDINYVFCEKVVSCLVEITKPTFPIFMHLEKQKAKSRDKGAMKNILRESSFKFHTFS